jgi:hypothetical protein
MSSSDADFIAAEGTEIRLADGETRRLRFDFRALLQIERAAGSVGALTKDLDASLHGKGLEALLVGLSAGLRIDQEALIDRLDSTRLRDYQAAVAVALREALRPTEGESGKGRAQTSDFPGQTSTDSSAVTSGALTPSSGT